jgi:predicted glycogen debranching enzyme
MGFIKFDKDQLINLEYSLGKEMLRSNRAGSFSCTTIVGCNTRKYHGLLVCPQPLLNNTIHVLLSKVDETIIQRDAEFNLGISKFPNSYNPKGHKYIRDFSADIIPKVTYRVGGVILCKETLFISFKQQVMIRYTLVEAQSPTTIRIRPYLAFRNIHQLSKKNIYHDTKYEAVSNGIKTKMYEGYSPLYLQFSKSAFEYVHTPDWYDDFEYYHEQRRGYEYTEDLYVPGFFELSIKKGESIILCAGTEEVSPLNINKVFNKELSIRTPRDSYEHSLINAAEQFFYRYEAGTDIKAGYPWYDRIGRFTFISLPGLAIAKSSEKMCQEVMQTMISQMKHGFFPETCRGEHTQYISADTSLWFIWALQKCFSEKENHAKIWKKYGHTITDILETYRQGTDFIKMDNNHLLYIDEKYPNITWMNATVNGNPVTPRFGYVVEVNALWYNAIMYALEIAESAKDKEFAKKWKPVAEAIPEEFQKLFWFEQKNRLYDYISYQHVESNMRPNQLIAASMIYSPLTEEMRRAVVHSVIKKLLTPRGLRTLSPANPFYKGRYMGNEEERDKSLHQGTVHPWLLGHFAEAYLKVYGKPGISFIDMIYNNFQEDMIEDGIGTISEIYEGDPPHSGRGAISFAASVAELIRIKNMIDSMK